MKKTSIKRAVAALLAVLMVFSVMQITAFGDTTWVSNREVGLASDGSVTRWNYGMYTGYINTSTGLPEGYGTLYYYNDREGKITNITDSTVYGICDYVNDHTDHNAYKYEGYFVDGYCNGAGKQYFYNKGDGEAICLDGTFTGKLVPNEVAWTGSLLIKDTSGNYVKVATGKKVADTNIYSHMEWDFIIYYDANGGTGAPGAQDKLYDQAMTISSTVPTREGYNFLGWATSASATSPSYYPGSTFNENKLVKFYAVWQEKTYTVSYNANGGTNAPASQTKYYFSQLNLSSAKPSRSYTAVFDANGGSCSEASRTLDCTFVNWNTSANGSGTAYSSGGAYTTNASTTLYAQYTNPAYGKMPVPTRSGYQFMGWYTSTTGGTRVFASSILNGNTTLYARWAKEYSVEYDANGGSPAPETQIKLEDIDLTLSGFVPQKEGNTFVSWNTKADGSGTTYNSGDTYTANSSTKLYAQWKKNTYKVTYYVNGVPYITESYLYEDKITPAADPALDGYTFLGWTPSVPETMPAKDLEFYAIWEIECDHENVKTVTETPTCTEDGSTYTVCLDCGAIVKELEVIPATGHSEELSWVTVTQPTCTQDGSEAGFCKYCGMLINSKAIAATDHDDGVWIVDTEPTADHDGQKTLYCSKCGEVLDVQTITMHTHIGDETVTVLYPTCTQKGIKGYICDTCGAVYKQEEIAALGHSDELSWVTLTQATCTEEGSKAGYCKTCGELISSQVIAATGHDDGVWIVDTEPTADHDGQKTLYCSKCHVVLDTQAITMHTHSGDDTVTILYPTCTQKGIKGYVCDKCGAVYKQEEIPAAGHSENLVWTVTTTATCTSAGEKIGTCPICGKTIETAAISATGHSKDLVWTVNTPATCTADGEKTGACSICGKVIKTEIIPATGHSEDLEWTVNVPATCTEAGEKVGTCTVCGKAIKTETIPATGHGETTYIVTVQPTCSTKGIKTGYCSICGKLVSSEDIAAEGHTLGEWVTNHNGTHSRSCSVCMSEETKGCSYSVETVAATCYLPEYHIYTCTVCGYSYNDLESVINGKSSEETVVPVHEWTDWADIGDGTTHSRTCLVDGCGDIETEEHSFTDWTYNKDGKMFKNGTKTRTCTVCGGSETAEALHTSYIGGFFYRVMLLFCNFFNKIFYGTTLDWLFPWINIYPEM